MMKIRVAAVVAIGIAITLELVFLLSGGGAEVFATKSKLITYMPNSSGMIKSSPVRINGIEVGRVTAVEVSPSNEPQRAVRVEAVVRTSYLKAIPRDSVASVRADNLVGDKFLLITQGRSPLPVTEGGELPSEELNLAFDNADLMRTLERNLSQVEAILVDLQSPNSKVGQLVYGDDYYKTLLSRVVGFNNGLHSILTPKSDIGKAFYTLEAYRNIRDPLLKFSAQLAAIQNGEGQMGRLFATDQQYNDMVKGLRDFRASLADANTGNGALGKALKSDEDYRRLQYLIRSTDAMIASFNAGEGKFGQLLANPQLYESLSGSLRSFERMLQDVRQNPKKYLRVKIF